MPYNGLVTRSESAALIPEDVQREIVQGVTNKSVVLQKFRHRSMSTAQQRMPVLSQLPTAYWVNGDTGLKQTTEVAWANKYLDAEEVAAIVPIPEKVLDDVKYNLWDEIRPLLTEAIAIALDEAVLFGVNKPATWPTAIVPAATAAGNAANSGVGVDIAADINTVMSLVEADGFEVNGFVGRPQLKGTLRNLRATTNEFIFNPDVGARDARFSGTLFGEPLAISMAGMSGFATGTGNAHLIAGDWSQGIVGIRQDITIKMLDQAVIQDNLGAIIYNLPQQDMVAMRVVARYAFQVPNPMSRLQPTEASRYPFGVLKQP